MDQTVSNESDSSHGSGMNDAESLSHSFRSISISSPMGPGNTPLASPQAQNAEPLEVGGDHEGSSHDEEDDDSNESSGDDPSYQLSAGPGEESNQDIVLTLKSISSHQCCIYGCNEPSLTVVPVKTREEAAMFRVFIPKGARYCRDHSNDLFNMEEVRISPESMTLVDYEEHISLLIGCISHQGHIATQQAGENDALLKNLTSLSFSQFADLASYVNTPDPFQSLGAFMFRMRSGQPIDRIAMLFGYATETFRWRIDSVMEDLNSNFKPLNLGLGHITSEQASQHTTHMPRTLLLIESQIRSRSKITI